MRVIANMGVIADHVPPNRLLLNTRLWQTSDGRLSELLGPKRPVRIRS